MDRHERSRIRAQAEWRARRAGKTSSSLWGFENWGERGHSKAITSLGKSTAINLSTCRSACTASLRGVRWRNILRMEPTPKTRWNGRGGWPLGVADICECVADLLRFCGETLIRAAKDGRPELKD